MNITYIEFANKDCLCVQSKIVLKDKANITLGAFYRQPYDHIAEYTKLKQNNIIHHWRVFQPLWNHSG